jgi:hypothetical protein
METVGGSGAGTDPDLSTWSGIATRAAQLARAHAGPWDRVADRAGWEEDGVPFHAPEDIRKHWLAVLRERVGYGPGGDYDNVIALTARKGRSKSTLGLSLGMWLSPKRFTLENVVFRGADLVGKYETAKRGDVIVYDEAVLGLLSTDWWTYEAKDLVKAVTIARDVHAHTILCLPRFARLNKTFREDLVDFWIRVDTRGTGYVHEPAPKERYSDWRGVGFFPDKEWNPLTWDSLKGDPIWKNYSKLRKAARHAFHVAAKERMERGGTAAVEDDRLGSQINRHDPLRCESCGLEFSRRDAYLRHLGGRGHAKLAGISTETPT